MTLEVALVGTGHAPAVELGGKGITVNAVSPGLTEDSVLNGLPDEVVEAARNWHTSGWTPMGRMGTPADIGNVVSLLCSEQAGWITGQNLSIDGGQSVRKGADYGAFSRARFADDPKWRLVEEGS